MSNFKFRAYYKPHLDKGIIEMFEQVEKDNKLFFVSCLNDEVIYDFYIPFIDDDWLVEQALKRNEPMAVIVHRYNFQRYNFETSDYWAEFYCPKCETVVSIGDKFCSECGQALDWGGRK